MERVNLTPADGRSLVQLIGEQNQIDSAAVSAMFIPVTPGRIRQEELLRRELLSEAINVAHEQNLHWPGKVHRSVGDKVFLDVISI